MDADTARWLVSAEAAAVVAAAMRETDPGSLAAAARLRALAAPAHAAAALTQASLRARAEAKFGARAASLWFTPDGLEQATRAPVARRRAAIMAGRASSIADLGCGLGADALAFADAGLRVEAVERDEATAVLAAANLGRAVRVGGAEELWPLLADEVEAVFCDPARRTASGRTWRVEDLTPPWSFVAGLLAGGRPACVKLGPGVPLDLVGEGVEAEWVSDRGTVVECALWAGPGTVPGRRRAVVDGHAWHRDGPVPDAPAEAVGEWLYEPDGAVIRAGLVGELARTLGAHRVHPQVAYLTGPAPARTPWAAAFEVLEVLPFDERVLRGWVRDQHVGTLEIKKRGLDVDPAGLRRRLRPSGRNAATLVLTPTVEGARALVVRRA